MTYDELACSSDNATTTSDLLSSRLVIKDNNLPLLIALLSFALSTTNQTNAASMAMHQNNFVNIVKCAMNYAPTSVFD